MVEGLGQHAHLVGARDVDLVAVGAAGDALGALGQLLDRQCDPPGQPERQRHGQDARDAGGSPHQRAEVGQLALDGVQQQRDADVADALLAGGDADGGVAVGLVRGLAGARGGAKAAAACAGDLGAVAVVVHVAGVGVGVEQHLARFVDQRDARQQLLAQPFERGVQLGERLVLAGQDDLAHQERLDAQAFFELFLVIALDAIADDGPETDDGRQEQQPVGAEQAPEQGGTPHLGKIRNPKLEIRNKYKIRIRQNGRNGRWPTDRRFRSFLLLFYSDLFRISCFGFRI